MINKNYYQILIALQNNKCINELQSMSINQIIENTKLSESTIRKALAEFLKLQYVSEGYKAQRQKTYFITEEGDAVIQQIKDYKKEIKNINDKIKI